MDRPPDPPENANAPAGDRGERENLNDERTLSETRPPVKRYCRPVAVADIARQAFGRLLMQFQEDAARKGKNV